MKRLILFLLCFQASVISWGPAAHSAATNPLDQLKDGLTALKSKLAQLGSSLADLPYVPNVKKIIDADAEFREKIKEIYSSLNFETYNNLQGMITFANKIKTQVEDMIVAIPVRTTDKSGAPSKLSFDNLVKALEKRANEVFDGASISIKNRIKAYTIQNLQHLATFDQYLTINRTNVTEWSNFPTAMTTGLSANEVALLEKVFARTRENIINDAIFDSLGSNPKQTKLALLAILKVLYTDTAGYENIQLGKDKPEAEEHCAQIIELILTDLAERLNNREKSTAATRIVSGRTVAGDVTTFNSGDFTNSLIQIVGPNVSLNASVIKEELAEVIAHHPELKRIDPEILTNFNLAVDSATSTGITRLAIKNIEAFLPFTETLCTNCDLANNLQTTQNINGTAHPLGGKHELDHRPLLIKKIFTRIYNAFASVIKPEAFKNIGTHYYLEKSYFRYLFDNIQENATSINDFVTHLVEENSIPPYFNVPASTDRLSLVASFNQQVIDTIAAFSYKTTSTGNPWNDEPIVNLSISLGFLTKEDFLQQFLVISLNQ